MAIGPLSPGDPHSFSRPDDVAVSHMHLSLEVDFERNTLSGFVDLTVDRKLKKATTLILDSRDEKILQIIDQKTGISLDYSVDEPILSFGSKLSISLPKVPDDNLVIRIKYETSPSAESLQWLKPEQTCGKKLPYLFSQCQPIHCRSMVPCQDTPSVKVTYTAEITVPSNLVALMSAIKAGEPTPIDRSRSIHKFEQKVPIPTYLIALAVGALDFRKIGPRSNVWSEKEYVEKAAYEFADTEKMLHTAEEICGPYVWGIYDLLVLPPSFPYGGMENPCLTFVTPTLLAGDRSLADVVVHEITHSWTGNLVTNKTFEHFWLNEGFTMFVERKILGRMFGDKYRHFSAIGGLKDLKEGIEARKKDDPTTCLVPNLKGVHPDDAFSTCPYEKGHTILFHLETLLGGSGIAQLLLSVITWRIRKTESLRAGKWEKCKDSPFPRKKKVFDPFLKDYLDHFKHQSIVTNDFIKYLNEYFPDNKDLKSFDWELWLNTPGMPPLSKKWLSWDGQGDCPFQISDLSSFTAQQVKEFVALLLHESPLSLQKLKTMDKVYDLSSKTNAEIRFRWLRLCIKGKWEEKIVDSLDFVSEQGRMKYVRPIYRDLCAWEAAREQAIARFEETKSNFMYVARSLLARDLNLRE
uniref:Peptidase M1 leukotriene A4 hydrolase/aminopeptidase C-terminal domain-containing protein n=1 Tax=Timema monikensis TaxID=170555 RepID=A0A7R9EGS7_9NEOP|nr:unnamed protein product [Timema monikensis]